MRTSLVIIILLFLSSDGFSQPYSCYTNDQDKFYVMDGEIVRQVEYLAPIEYKIGANCIAYVDNTKNFKIYYKGESKLLAEGYTTDYSVSTDLVVIIANGFLYVFDNGHVKLLSSLTNRYVSGDSIVAFNDNQHYTFNYYWNGKIEKLEDILGADPITNIAAGDNVFAYNNTYNTFKIVYRGEVIEQEGQAALNFRASANTVAYIDYNNTFKIFYKGETFEISPFLPKSFSIGDNIVAYVDNNGGFNIFYDGKITDMGTFTPSYLNVVDNMVVYADAAGGLSVFYKGNITRLENYIPQNIQVSSNSLSYVDNSNHIQFFTYGKSVKMPNESLEGVNLDYDVLKIKTGFNSYKFYWKDKVVE